MKFGKTHNVVKNRVANTKSLREYSDAELQEFLERNLLTDVSVLACICSEVLRRMLKKEVDGAGG